MRAWLKPVGVGAGGLALLGAIAYYAEYQRHGRYVQTTNDATIQADQVAISAKLAGYVKKVAVEDNQDVRAGAELVEIDPVDYRVRLKAAESQIASAIAAGRASSASRAEAEAALDQAQAGLKAGEATLAFAIREAARFQPLVASGAEPASTLSQLIANRDRAVADVAAQHAAVLQAKRRIDTISAQEGQTRAQTETARAERMGAANDLLATHLSAPITGRIANRSVRVGQYIQPGTRLMTVVPAGQTYVVANFKETQVGLMRAGQPARIRVDALPGISFTGAVASVTPGTGANFSLIPPQNATGNFTKIVQRVPVRISINAGPIARKLLMPGLSLEVEVDTSAQKAELDSVRSEQDRLGS